MLWRWRIYQRGLKLCYKEYPTKERKYAQQREAKNGYVAKRMPNQTLITESRSETWPQTYFIAIPLSDEFSCPWSYVTQAVQSLLHSPRLTTWPLLASLPPVLVPGEGEGRGETGGKSPWPLTTALWCRGELVVWRSNGRCGGSLHSLPARLWSGGVDWHKRTVVCS